MVIKFKNLNNKSRKGTYLYIKEKGLPSRYYKLNDVMDNVNPYITFYKKKYIEKTDANLKELKKYYEEKKPQSEYKQKYGKRKLTSIFKKSISNIKIDNVHQLDNINVNKKNIELLKKSVIDEGILEVLIQEENLQKLKFRFNHMIKFIGEDGNVLAEDTLLGKYTLRDIVTKITQNVSRGEYIDTSSGWKTINDRLGTQIKNASTGVIARIELISTFTYGGKK